MSTLASSSPPSSTKGKSNLAKNACPECGASASSVTSLAQHRSIAHGVSLPSPSPKTIDPPKKNRKQTKSKSNTEKKSVESGTPSRDPSTADSTNESGNPGRNPNKRNKNKTNSKTRTKTSKSNNSSQNSSFENKNSVSTETTQSTKQHSSNSPQQQSKHHDSRKTSKKNHKSRKTPENSGSESSTSTPTDDSQHKQQQQHYHQSPTSHSKHYHNKEPHSTKNSNNFSKTQKSPVAEWVIFISIQSTGTRNLDEEGLVEIGATAIPRDRDNNPPFSFHKYIDPQNSVWEQAHVKGFWGKHSRRSIFRRLQGDLDASDIIVEPIEKVMNDFSSFVQSLPNVVFVSQNPTFDAGILNSKLADWQHPILERSNKKYIQRVVNLTDLTSGIQLVHDISFPRFQANDGPYNCLTESQRLSFLFDSLAKHFGKDALFHAISRPQYFNRNKVGNRRSTNRNENNGRNGRSGRSGRNNQGGRNNHSDRNNHNDRKRTHESNSHRVSDGSRHTPSNDRRKTRASVHTNPSSNNT